MPDAFGSFQWICSHTPLSQCNLFFSQYYNSQDAPLTLLFPSNSSFFEQYDVTSSNFADDPNVLAATKDAGVGIGSNCQIPRVGHRGSLGDIALIIVSALSVFLMGFLVWRANKRKAAVGLSELKALLIMYALTMIFQLLSMASLYQQGSVVLSVFSAIHLGLLVAGYWVLAWNAVIAMQPGLDDGTLASLVPMTLVGLLLFAPTLYISLDTSQNWTNTFTLGNNVQARTLFVLTLIWPALAATVYGFLMIFVSSVRLGEHKPALMYLAAGILFAGSQVVFFLASQPLCDVSNRKINSSFLATILQTSSMVIMYFAWECITEDIWPNPEDQQDPWGNYGNVNGNTYGTGY